MNIAILGANGTMGKNAAAMFASFGKAEKVYLVCRTKEKAANAIDSIFSLVHSDVFRDALLPITYDDLAMVAPDVDFFFESISEDLEIKANLFASISILKLKDNCILASGTSSISINKIADSLSDSLKTRFLGFHLFNPSYAMPLLEIIPSIYTNQETIDKCISLAEILQREYVICKDCAGFLANRIGFFVIADAMNDACSLGVEKSDALSGCFTGKNMSPLKTADYVGLDVTNAILNTIANEDSRDDPFLKTFIPPRYLEFLLEENLLGHKTSSNGLYNSDGCALDCTSLEYKSEKSYTSTSIDLILNFLRDGGYSAYSKFLLGSKKPNIVTIRKRMVSYIVYSLFVANHVAQNISDCDIAMQYGFGWVPPIALLDFFGGKANLKKLIVSSNINISDENIDLLVSKCPEKSKFDYRKFMKARIY